MSLLLLADLRGVLEPCGCGGRPSGGLDRIAGTIASWRARRQPSLLLAAGELFDSDGASQPQATLEQDTLIALLARLRPDAIVASDAARGHAPAIASLARASGAALIVPGLSTADGLSAGSSALLRAGAFGVGLVLASPETTATAARSVSTLRERGAHAVVLACSAPCALPSTLLDQVDVAIVLGSTAETTRREQDTLVVDPGDHGESLWKIELTRLGDGVSAVAERHPLGTDAASDPSVRALLDQTFARINARNASVAATAPATGVRSSATSATSAAFVGARTCAACHVSEYLWWQQTAHGRAYATLERRGRELDLDCVGCHVTGFGEPLGASLGHLTELTAVGCESCHGPGGRHADNPTDRRSRMRKTAEPARCVRCHDAAHSPQFSYETFRQRLIAPGHGAAVARGAPRQTP